MSDDDSDTPVMSLTVNGADVFVAGGPNDESADDLKDAFDHVLDRYIELEFPEEGRGVQ